MDITHLQGWIGRETFSQDLLSVRHARLMAATLGRDQEALVEGSALPPLWHWLYFLEGLPPAELGRDGHPAPGGFLPPVPLPNRMWAGGTLEFLRPLRLGKPAEKRSRIQSVEHKQGRSGELVFVSVEHQVSQDGKPALRELHDIVYKEASRQGAVPAASPAPAESVRSASYRPDSTQLFRYSALTFNGHRIHYDLDYCRQVEGYDNLVIHGPLNATLLAQWAQDIAQQPLRRFVYRGVSPALLGQTLSLHAAAPRAGKPLKVWVELEGGAVSMQADAFF